MIREFLSIFFFQFARVFFSPLNPENQAIAEALGFEQ